MPEPTKVTPLEAAARALYATSQWPTMLEATASARAALTAAIEALPPLVDVFPNMPDAPEPAAAPGVTVVKTTRLKFSREVVRAALLGEGND